MFGLPLRVALTPNQLALGIETTGTRCVVPDDAYIKLCYYLQSVASTDYRHSIPANLPKWQSLRTSANLRTDDLRSIVALADLHSPAKLRAAGFFLMVPHGTLPLLNQFVTLSATSTGAALIGNSSMALAMVRRSYASIKVMLYEELWEDTNYYDPLRVIQDRILRRDKRRVYGKR
jgi:hypothetical protein